MSPRRSMAMLWPFLGLTILAGSCFHAVLFRNEQFAYRDSAYYYYPLHQVTARQWRSGHLPLWDPSENGGMPLLGNPTAAVLYPGKLAFAILPYPWAAKVYLLAHVALAFAAMTILLRGLEISGTGASLGALSYAFGGPILFQYTNAIYLVGAAWLPLGFLAVDGWLRRARRGSAALLAVVLAMQSLGGDLQTCYVLGLFAALYALWLNRAPIPRVLVLSRLAMAILAWFVGTLLVALWLPEWREWGISSPTLVWMNRVGKTLGLLAIVAILLRSLRGPFARVSNGLFGLVSAAVVGFALAGAQMAPVGEMAIRSIRLSGERSIGVYFFSVEPYRLAELSWPGFFGVEFPENRLWMLALPPVPGRALWTASLYAGVFTLVLAIGGVRPRESPSWRGPMAFLGLAATLLALGRFGGPLWWVRWISSTYGGLDPGGPGLFRPDNGRVRDAFGSPFWLLAWLAPGFGGFRYPAKFLTFAMLAFSSLAALGWDRAAKGSSRTAWVIAGVSIAVLLPTFPFQGGMKSWFASNAKVPSIGGPLDPSGCLFEIRRSLIHGAIVAVASGLVMMASARGRKFAGPAAIVLMAIDLSVANSRIVWSVPQGEFDREPMAMKVLAEAEAKSPQAGPYRLHRIPFWRPVDWVRRRSPDRLREVVAWERDSLQASYGSAYGVKYVMNPGSVEPIDFLQLVDTFPVTLDPESAHMIVGKPGVPMQYFPRRSFDMWGARYFLLPIVEDDWSSSQRAIAAFGTESKPIFPLANKVDLDRWRERQDWQILRNNLAYPRAWVVHEAHVRDTFPEGSETAEAKGWRKAILYRPDPFWQIPGRPVEDPRQVAWIEMDDPKSVRLDLGKPPSSPETVTFERDEPSRVELMAKLESPGLVVLSDSFDPGWKLTIDGRPAPILRANRMMRGAAVPSGTHRLVYSYEPVSLKIGLVLSSLGVIGLAGLAFLKPPRGEDSPAWEPSKPSTTPPMSA